MLFEITLYTSFNYLGLESYLPVTNTATPFTSPVFNHPYFQLLRVIFFGVSLIKEIYDFSILSDLPCIYFFFLFVISFFFLLLS